MSFFLVRRGRALSAGTDRPIARGSLVVLLACVSILSARPGALRAQESAPRVEDEAPRRRGTASRDRAGGDAPSGRRDEGTRDSVGSDARRGGARDTVGVASGSEDPSSEPGRRARELPTGESATSTSPQSVRLPTGEGSVQGMGESFSPELSTGNASYSVPIGVPPGRNGVQPSLSLVYSSSNGNGVVGVGWSLGVPFIARQTDRGLPRYEDQGTWSGREDRFVYNGGQELVPVDTSAMAIVDGRGLGPNGGDATAAAGIVPDDVVDWQQYRSKIEGSFLRFFRSPDGKRWVVQGLDGMRYDFGLLPVGEGPADLNRVAALTSEGGGGTGRIFSWLLTRTSDANGSTIYYQYEEQGTARYLSDVYYVSPASCVPTPPAVVTVAATRGCTETFASYGVHLRFEYEGRLDTFTSYRTGWGITLGRRLARVTSFVAGATKGARYFAHRVHLGYDASLFHSLLTSVQVEGRAEEPSAYAGIARGAMTLESAVGPDFTGRRLPALRLEYTTMPQAGPQAIGFGGLDATVRSVVGSPPVSLDAPLVDLFDVNGDGLQDVLVTDGAQYHAPGGGLAVGVYWNGFTGAGATPAARGATFSQAVAVPLEAPGASLLQYTNPNLLAMDVDGDGRGDFVDLPANLAHGWITPARLLPIPAATPTQQNWAFVHTPRPVLPGSDPQIRLAVDGSFFRTLDVNGDNLVDIVRTSGSSMQTWFNLGFVEGGEGRFGSPVWNATSRRFEVSPEPSSSCVLHDGLPVDFGTPDVRVAEMNGDGVPDLVRLSSGRITYWPGRGNGTWGDGPASCPGGTTAANRHRTFASPPETLNPNLAGVYLHDVDGDGADDVVQVRFQQVDVWFNRAGQSFTEKITIDSPYAPDFAPNLRFVDIDGSGTTDLLYGKANAWRYVDLLAGHRPRLLSRVHNGLGATTSLEYGSSIEDYLRDLSAAVACTDPSCERFTWDGVRGSACDSVIDGYADECVYRSGGSPVVASVLRRVQTTDNFVAVSGASQVSTTEYAYHDGYYEGIEQEFRGFGAADVHVVGDATVAGQWTRAYFFQGRRPNEIATDRLVENPEEALKAIPYLTETFDEGGRYASTTHEGFLVRRLATGLDGRPVTFAAPLRSDRFVYDTTTYQPQSAVIELPSTRWEVTASNGAASVDRPAETRDVRVRAGRFVWTRSESPTIDNLGQPTVSIASGRLHDEGDGPSPLPEKSYHESIRSEAVHQLLPDVAGGWVVRPIRSWTADGETPAAHLGETTTSYDERGRPTLVVQLVANAATLDFGAASGYAYALGGPAQLLQTSRRYDALGSPVESCSGADLTATGAAALDCLRYTKLTYDLAYRQLVTTEEMARGTTSLDLLAYQATWDRAHGALLSSTDANGATSTAVYDGLGRIVATDVPDSFGCSSGGAPETTFSYVLADELGLPLSYVETREDARVVGATDCTGPRLHVARAYVDGLGRPRGGVRFAGARVVVSGLVELDARGTPRKAYEPAFVETNAPSPTSILRPSAGLGFVLARYDSFGRAVATTRQDGATARVEFHASSVVTFDPNDDPEQNVDSPQDHGTPGITRTDGHGRAIEVVEMLRQPGEPQSNVRYLHLVSRYRADGKLLSARRVETASAAPYVPGAEVGGHFVERTFTYDSAGRRVASSDPDSDARSGSESARHWRYRFNVLGEIAAVRDPRGCGQDFFYDRAGRMVGEDYVGCGEAQSLAETAVDAVTAMGMAPNTTRAVDVRYFYDSAPPSWVSAALPSGLVSAPLGRPTGSVDRAQRIAAVYDARGNLTWTARQLAVVPLASTIAQTFLTTDPPVASDAATEPSRPAPEFDPTLYVSSTRFDGAGRPYRRDLPTDPDWELYRPSLPSPPADAPAIQGRLTYDERGLPSSASILIGGASRTILASASYDAWNAPTSMLFGAADVDHGVLQTFTYDRLHRPLEVRAERGRLSGISTLPLVATNLNAVEVPFDEAYEWDRSGNLVRITSHAGPDPFPAGFRQTRRTIDHDSLNRVAHVAYDFLQSDRTWRATDVATDYREARTDPTTDGVPHVAADPMHAQPPDMLPTPPSERLADLIYEYDWLANETTWEDDARSFFERSIGAITNGADRAEGRGLAPTLRPSALYVASNLPEVDVDDPAPVEVHGNEGWLDVDYGTSGNVVALTVRSQCVDRGTATCADPRSLSPEAREAALVAACACANEQHFEYRWDELNRISEARRYDRHGGTGNWSLAARQRYRYDASNQRLIKQVLDPAQATEPPETPSERIHLYVFPGDFERVGVATDRTGTPRYRGSTALGTETQYHVAGATLVHDASAVTPTVLDRSHRLTLAIRDLLGTASAVLDLESGHLLELSTFTPNGARETHWMTREAGVAPERYAFTGKEEDEEVGLTYFGERYLIPRLGRWASPDPLEIHALGGGEILNEFHYVDGNLLQSNDPIGLAGRCGRQQTCTQPFQEDSQATYDTDNLVEVAQKDADGNVARWRVRAEIADRFQEALNDLSARGIYLFDLEYAGRGRRRHATGRTISGGGLRRPSIDCNVATCQDTRRNPIRDAGNPNEPRTPLSDHSLGLAIDTVISNHGFRDPQNDRFVMVVEYADGIQDAAHLRLRVYARSDEVNGSQENLNAIQVDRGGHVQMVAVSGYFVNVTAVFESHGVHRTVARENWRNALHQAMSGRRVRAPNGDLHNLEAHHFESREGFVGRSYWDLVDEVWNSPRSNQWLYRNRSLILGETGLEGIPRTR